MMRSTAARPAPPAASLDSASDDRPRNNGTQQLAGALRAPSRERRRSLVRASRVARRAPPPWCVRLCQARSPTRAHKSRVHTGLRTHAERPAHRPHSCRKQPRSTCGEVHVERSLVRYAADRSRLLGLRRGWLVIGAHPILDCRLHLMQFAGKEVLRAIHDHQLFGLGSFVIHFFQYLERRILIF